jgi:glycosyltransferase involved in cell wall biosynthesis
VTTVTAVVPTFNRARTLARALTSILEQTRVPDDIVVVDDASTDDTAAVLRQFPPVRVVHLERNGGAARARNEGVRHARGELVAFLDSDDVWLREKLARQLARFGDADLLCTGVRVHERGGRVADHRGAGPRAQSGWSFADFQSYPFAPTTWLIRRAVLDALGGFDEALRNAEDLDLLARLADRRIDVLPDVLAIKHNRADSLDAERDRTAASYRILLRKHAALWARTPAAAARGWRRIANMHFDAREPGAARRALLAGLRLAPTDWRSWGLLAASAFGTPGVRALRRLSPAP